MEKQLPPTPWRETSLYQNLKEVTREGYEQMLAYEAAGGVLDVREQSAKKFFEKYYKRKKSKNYNSPEIEVDGDVEHTDSWDDE